MKRVERCWLVGVVLSSCLGAIPASPAGAGDWPMWRYDAGRTANSPERLPEELHPLWVRHLPPLQPAFTQVRQHRVQFDLGYEPVVSGKTLLVGSSRNDCVLAMDTDTGAERWRFDTDGPVRTAPAIWEGKAYVGCDDGHLYCLDLPSGRLLWKFRASPSPRKILGNGRLISVWPVRGGPVVADKTVYFAAGVWPSEGVFVYAVDAESGDMWWINDRSGSLYAQHPHGAMAFGGPSPMGYLLVRGEELIVPSGRAFPAYFDRATGKLNEFEFGHGGHGSRPGGWFLATGSGGELVVDRRINTEIHDAGQQTIGQRDVRPQKDEVLQEQIQIGTRSYRIVDGIHRWITLGGEGCGFDHPPVAVDGEVHTMLAADGKLFVVTRQGSLHGFGPRPAQTHRHPAEQTALEPVGNRWAAQAEAALQYPKRKAGFALVWGLSDGGLVEALLQRTEYHVIAVDPDSQKVGALRRRLDAAGWYGSRVAVHVGDPLRFGFPACLAELVVSEDLRSLGEWDKGLAAAIVHVLHPFGGAACLVTTDEEDEKLAAACGSIDLAGVARRRAGGHSLLIRAGALPGSADYAGVQNFDARVQAPLGLLWFGDTFHHHKLFYRTFSHEAGRGLPTEMTVSQGVMKYATTDAYGPNPPGVGYHDYLRWLEREKTYTASFTDLYTGRVLAADEAAAIPFPAVAETKTPSQPRPLTPAARKNPLTGVVEGRAMLKTYGCDRDPVDYGDVVTYRSGTAAFYDKRLESGTINIGGVRSGCRNSLVPAGGVLAMPSWTGNCTCNYPVYTSLAMVSMPASCEQWSAWGDVAVEAPVVRAGINFGAPGDRVAPDGTLWLDCPSVGGPSPRIPVEIAPADAEPFYRHALRMDAGEGWPWVAASGLAGVRSIKLEPVARRSEPPNAAISVRWCGAVRPEFEEQYTFHVQTDQAIRLWIGDQLLLDNSKNLRRGEKGEISAVVDLKAGVRVPLTLEYAQASGAAAPTGQVRLSWSSPSLAKSVVPSQALFAADGTPGGLTAAYFDHPAFSGPAALTTDPQVDFRWDGGRPQILMRNESLRADPQRVFTVKLYFAEPENLRVGERVFSVSLQGKRVIDGLDVVREAGGPHRPVVRTFAGIPVEQSLHIDLAPAGQRPPVISGVELVAE